MVCLPEILFANQSSMLFDFSIVYSDHRRPGFTLTSHFLAIKQGLSLKKVKGDDNNMVTQYDISLNTSGLSGTCTYYN